jgi:hypothetical protein
MKAETQKLGKTEENKENHIEKRQEKQSHKKEKSHKK